jgi:IS30 family transposase
MPYQSTDPLTVQLFFASLAKTGDVAASARELGLNKWTCYAWIRRKDLPGKPRAAHPGKQRYLQLREQGMPRRRAAAQVGIGLTAAYEWDRGVHRVTIEGRRVRLGRDHADQVPVRSRPLPAPVPDIDGRYLTLLEREQIADLRRAGRSIRQIAAELGRVPSSISREIRRNCDEHGRYLPHAAHRAAARRRPRPKPAKLVANRQLASWIQEKLRRRWSPQQIAARLRCDFPDQPELWVCHETIYRALYLQARGGLRREVATALRTGRARRRPHRDPAARRPRFTDPMIMISERPAEVADRAIPGHWEGDLIIGADGGSAIGTLVERTTRYLLLVHLPGGDRTAEAVRDQLIPTITTLPAQLRRSLTWDQGSEMAAHRSFSIATDMPVYFCDPASPWQRGSNENTNGLLRQYFPKGTDLSAHTPEHLTAVAIELNGRPRQTLNWRTPAEALRDLLDHAA